MPIRSKITLRLLRSPGCRISRPRAYIAATRPSRGISARPAPPWVIASGARWRLLLSPPRPYRQRRVSVCARRAFRRVARQDLPVTLRKLPERSGRGAVALRRAPVTRIGERPGGQSTFSVSMADHLGRPLADGTRCEAADLFRGRRQALGITYTPCRDTSEPSEMKVSIHERHTPFHH
jgi:hypothetical protein